MSAPDLSTRLAQIVATGLVRQVGPHTWGPASSDAEAACLAREANELAYPLAGRLAG